MINSQAMKVICAPDKFKGSLTAAQAAAAMARGIAQVRPDANIDLCPIADGGEGTVEALLAATGGQGRWTRVAGPLLEPVDAAWGILGKAGDGVTTAFIEMAAASGMVLLPAGRRDPTRTTTLGTGQLIRQALEEGAQAILLGIGGSATNDGGCGAAAALGVRFFDHSGQAIEPAPTGGTLQNISRIEMSRLDPRIRRTILTVACDVTNPLTGPNGAAAIYSPQKGANPEQVRELDRGLAHLARLWREQLGVDVEELPGAGAAGGLGGGLVAFLGAKLVRGVELVIKAARFEERVAGCDLCLTGEGRLDGSSLSGKACLGVAAVAKRHGVKTVALVGSVGPGAEEALQLGLTAYRVIGAGLPVEESIRRAGELLQAATAEAVRGC